MKSLLPSLLKATLAIAGIIAIAYLSLCTYLIFRQNRLIFFPSPIVETTPLELGIPYEDVWLSVESRSVAKAQTPQRIHGWWIPAPTPATAPTATDQTNATDQANERVLLYLHGNGGNITDNLEHAARFHRLGFSVLLIDYRGYGLSEGAFPTEKSVYQDAETAWQHLTQTRQINPQTIYLYGHSLGGAIAIDLAMHHPDAAGLMVESSFTSMAEMASWLGEYRLIPVNLLLNQRFDSLTKVRFLQMPVLFIHGTQDTEVPAQMSQRLYAAAPEPKRLWLVPNANHNTVATVAGPAYFETIRSFTNWVNAQTVALAPKP